MRSSSSHTYTKVSSATRPNLERVCLRSPSSSDQSYPTLQVVLDEKNRLIDKLKKQIHNQRIQLEFYIKKEMNCPVMVEFAKTCLPELTDDNMTVVLAMNKFYRELGMKSRIMDLYERVCNVVGRTNCIIQTQEVILGEVINNMRQYMSPADVKKFLGNFDINTNYIELFNRLLDSTLSLKQSMAGFRNCCDRLINAEEKRNEIVEQVYSLPQEERAICNYLVNIQMEKFELENILKQLSRKHNRSEPPVDEIGLIENNLRLLHETFGGLRKEEEAGESIPASVPPPELAIRECCVTKMLEQVYQQAMSLLAVSREQRERYDKETEQLKEENGKLREIIQHIDGRRVAAKGADVHDVERLHDVIKKTISEARSFQRSKAEELRRKEEECEQLRRKLSEALLQKDRLQLMMDMSDSSEVNEVVVKD